MTDIKPSTPLPWNVDYDLARIVDATGHTIAAVKAENLNNARYIAHTANLYPELVDALIRALGSVRRDGNVGTLDSVNAVLAKAERKG